MKRKPSKSQIDFQITFSQAFTEYALSLAVFTVVLVADLWTKAWAMERLANESFHPISGIEWFEWVYSQNHGIAFGLPFGGLPLIVVSVGLILGFLLMLRSMFDLRTHSAKLLVGLVLAGAIGNLIDRIAFGFVRDFIRIGSWPLFNIADMAIVVGIGLLIVLLYLPSHES